MHETAPGVGRPSGGFIVCPTIGTFAILLVERRWLQLQQIGSRHRNELASPCARHVPGLFGMPCNALKLLVPACAPLAARNEALNAIRSCGKCRFCWGKRMVPRDRIELPTRGFSIHCSTN